jgi:hypothetical protein
MKVSLHELEHKIEIFVILSLYHLVQFYYVRMIQLLK